MLQQVQVDALDITILRGGGDAVGRWAIDHGFLLTPDAPEVLDFYSQRVEDLHGRALRRVACRGPRPAVG